MPDLSQVLTGDQVSVAGKAQASSPSTVAASSIRDSSLRISVTDRTGVISALSGSTFTLTDRNSRTLTITVKSGAKITLNGKTSSMSSLSNGMQANVHGTLGRSQTALLADRISARTPA